MERITLESGWPPSSEEEAQDQVKSQMFEKFENNVIPFKDKENVGDKAVEKPTLEPPKEIYNENSKAWEILHEDLHAETLQDAELNLADIKNQMNQALEDFRQQNFVRRILKTGDEAKKYLELEKHYNDYNRKLGSIRGILLKAESAPGNTIETVDAQNDQNNVIEIKKAA